ncbi:NADPH oxidase organizer 1-like [Solea senegalensis]|uniref:NADPH oxidase organizer 1-like n=1 Tax=Solea senegalensis TaxID=28829 RepID=A0AAV6RN42_SOLSE|nr:NADPH oxidase organizer 1-like [Solea senegalensis]KAG7506883.1 NADPH oxidase organizer 1-like [Solea senegalensis]
MTADQRCVITARIIGAVQKTKPKLKTFMISVLWSDNAEVIVYRSFQDFKKFHRDLKKRFPNMNPFQKKNRVIPKFHGKARRSSLPQKGSKRSVLRMKFLESYCDKLLQCEQNIIQSSEVTYFFTPKDQDLESDFTTNSVMTLLSDDMPDGGSGGDVSRQHAGNVSHPFVTQTYRCIAPYETKDTKNRAFNVDVDERLDVLIKDPAGWWLVEKEDKRMAWFPAPFLELLEGEDDDDAGFQLAGSLYCAVRSYSTKKEDEVSVPIGSVVEVLRKSDNGWWLIRLNGKAGYVPAMYLKPYNNPRAGIFSMQRKMHSSTLHLESRRESEASYSSSITEETNPGRGQPTAPGRIHKARSLDVLSETWLQGQAARGASTADSRKYSTSTESSFSGLSSSSESSQSLSPSPVSVDLPSVSPQPSTSSHGNTSPDFSNTSPDSQRSKSSDGAPRVPARPRTEEILTRCTTLTRKAALATKTVLRNQQFEASMADNSHYGHSDKIHVL